MKQPYYDICPACGANLDPGERCSDCQNEKEPSEAATSTEPRPNTSPSLYHDSDPVARVDFVLCPFPEGQNESYAITAIIDRAHCVPIIQGLSAEQAERIAKRMQLLLAELNTEKEEIPA